MRLSFAFHVIGIVLWVGGALMLTRAMAVALDEVGEAPVRKWAWRACVGYVLPGALITILTGLYQIVAGGGIGFYMAQGWFHGKLTLVLLMLLATLILTIKAKAMSYGKVVPKGTIMAIHGISGLTLFVVVLLTMLMRAGQ